MRDNRHHTNLWAERLSQVSLPDGEAAWQGMQLLLDEQMPVKKDRRRWILLILLLLLLIGVCNCPGHPGNRVSHGSDDQVVRAGDRGKLVSGGKPDGLTAPVRGGDPGGNVVAARVGDRQDGNVVAADSTDRGIPAGGSRRKGRKPKGREAFLNGEENITASDTGRSGTTPEAADKNTATTPGTATPPGQTKAVPPSPKKDSTSTQKKKQPPAEEKTRQRANGWTIGIGLNQFFTIGGQQASHYNSGGISGTLGDYIPVPMIRYHFNRKFFIQLEAQFNSPQYTGKNLLISLPPLDSLSPTVRRQSSVLIKKLFYFNVPLSLHYRVFKNLDVGTGIQFSQLSNGIGLFQDRTMNIGPGGIPDSLSATSKSFKGDTLYKKIRTTELRALLDASYTHGRLIFGIRYNQALSQFIHVQVAPGQITQARNSSLQVYLRYVLWDNQKKPLYPTK